ncbi:MAG: AraC family transcriptional regulator [Rikenellaceae bacterium]|nr:AraC family transcriptional regulator [Rikenellaceae bacterium]
MAEIFSMHPILLNAGLSRHHADWNWKNVSSPFARLYLILVGNAVIETPAGEIAIEPGRLYLIPPFTMHGYRCDDYLESYYFHIYEKPSAKVRFLEEYDLPPEVPACPLDRQLVERLLEINPGRELPHYDPSFYDNPASLMSYIRKNELNPPEVAVETTGLLSILLSRFLSGARVKNSINDSRIRAVVSHIRKNIDKPISVEELAGLCFLSHDHFIRLFKRELGTTPLEYVTRRKIENAQLMLTTTDLSVKNIAHRLAFNNLSYFNRLFKKTAGITPLQYRRQQ